LHGAPVIWDGPSITFVKEAFSDWTKPENQDRLTDLVWITRSDDHGVFNIKSEPAYVRNLSPAGTEWASGTTADYASLTYRNWEGWARSILNPPETVGKDAVLHLIAEDIYLDVKFTSWAGAGGGGAFTYTRSTNAVPEPASVSLLCLGGVVALIRRRR
jgi:hypothetical protein